MTEPHAPQQRAADRSRRRLLSLASDPLVRAVGRLPARVHTKLLVAFVGVERRSPAPLEKVRISPGASTASSRSTAVPCLAWSALVRGNAMPCVR